MQTTITTSDDRAVELETDVAGLWVRSGGRLSYLTATELAELAESTGV